MFHLMSKRKMVTFKSLLMARTIQWNQHNFFEMFRSIWISTFQFGAKKKKDVVEVVLLLCLWNNRSRQGGLHANDRLIYLQIYVYTGISLGKATVILLLNAHRLQAGGWNELKGPISDHPWDGSSPATPNKRPGVIGRKLSWIRHTEKYIAETFVPANHPRVHIAFMKLSCRRYDLLKYYVRAYQAVILCCSPMWSFPV